MKVVANNQVVLVIYGAGALGGACCVDRLENPLLGQVSKILFCNQSHFYTSVSFRSEDPKVTLSKKRHRVETLTPSQLANELCLPRELSSANQSQRLEVMIAVPPPALDSALQFFLERANSILQSFATVSINALSNGAVSQAIQDQAKELLQSQPRLELYRSLVVAGFFKDLETARQKSTHLQVIHTSGRMVYWNSLRQNPTQQLRAFDGSCLFEAVPTVAIRELELQKVFANVILGFGIQNRLLPNSALHEILPKEESFKLAKEFSSLFSEAGSAHELQDFLWKTVEQTHSNVNSVSRAWANSDTSLAKYFQSFVSERCSMQKFQGTQLIAFVKCLLEPIDV